jgi:hypothetical protein
MKIPCARQIAATSASQNGLRRAHCRALLSSLREKGVTRQARGDFFHWLQAVTLAGIALAAGAVPVERAFGALAVQRAGRLLRVSAIGF